MRRYLSDCSSDLQRYSKHPNSVNIRRRIHHPGSHECRHILDGHIGIEYQRRRLGLKPLPRRSRHRQQPECPNAQPVRDTTANLSFVHNLFPATTVDASSTYSTAYGGSGFPNQHIGDGANQFTNATSGYAGFVLDQGTASPLFGWMKITLDNSGNPGVIESWAFETTPNIAIQVAVVPEPTTALLLLAGMASALLRRRSQ
jgi:hypothetical protein